MTLVILVHERYLTCLDNKMAETKKTSPSSGLFFNPATNNVVGQAYNDLLYSQSERIKEEQTAATAAAALEKAQAKNLSDADEARRKLIKDQMEAAEKAAAAKKKELSTAIKNIDATPNLLWGSHGYALRGGGELLSANMPEYLEQYGVDHMYRKTEEYNKYLTEAQRIFNKTESLGRNKLLDYGEELEGTPGFLQGYNEEKYSEETSLLNQKDRFSIDFVNGEWQFTDKTDGSKYNGTDWIKKIDAEANSKFQDLPMRNFDLTVVNAFSNFRLGTRLKTRENMVKHLDDELGRVGSAFYNTAVNELYVNHLKENPEDQGSLTFKEFYSMDNNGLNKALEAVDNFKEDWMKMWDDKMAKDQSQSGGRRGKTQEDLSKIIQGYSISGSVNSDQNVMDLAAGSLSGVELGASGAALPPEALGLDGVSMLSPQITMGTDVDGWQVFKDTGVLSDEIKIRSAAIGPEGDLFVTFSGDFPVDRQQPDDYEDIRAAAGIVDDSDLEPEEDVATRTLEFATPAYNALIQKIGDKQVAGYTPTTARDIVNAFPDVANVSVADFYIGLLTLSKATNNKFYEDVLKQAESDGINAEELKRILDNQ